MKIFVSHSSINDAYAAMVREHIRDLLKPPPADTLLVDMDEIRAGQEWCAVLYDWLAVCDAAVILLNREALRSAWVRRETNILLWRRAVNSAFAVIPARLGDIKAGDLKENGFHDVSRLQMAEIGQQTETPADAKALAEKIVARLVSPLPDDDPMARWVIRVAERVRETDPRLRHYLNDAAQALGLTGEYLPKNWDEIGSHRLLAAQLLDEGLRDGRLRRAAAALADAFDRPYPFERLVVEIRPSWVNGEAARLLLPPIPDESHPADRRVLILNASSQEVANQYLARATFNKLDGYDPIDATCVAVGEGGAQELIALFEQAIRVKLCAEYYPPEDHDLPRDEETVYYLLVNVGNRSLKIVAEAVRAIHDWYPWLVIILLVGFSLPGEAELKAAGLDEAVVLAPTLGQKDEALAGQLVRKLAEFGNRWNASWGVAS